MFRRGEAVALLDFDFASPGRRTYDLANFARMCVPTDDDTGAPSSAGSPPTVPIGWP